MNAAERETWLAERRKGIGANQFTALPMPERFWSKTQKLGGCLIWVGSVNMNGYGCFLLDGKPQTASRVAYELSHGPIPVGLFVLHTCDNPKCVAPDHLYAGTHGQNMRDKVNRSRARGANGSRNCKAKLTDSQVEEIRASSEPSKVLATRHGVDRTIIQRIRSRRLWRHLP